MKLRISRQLHASALRCSAAVDDTLGDWIRNACRHFKAGRIPAVANRDDARFATRDGSTVVTIPEIDAPLDQIRLAIASAVVYCEARTPPPFDVKSVYQGDFIIESEDS